MKRIFISFCMLYLWFANAMDNESASKRLSCSPARKSQLKQHKRSHSISDKVLAVLHLKTEEIETTPTVAALVTDRRSVYAPVEAPQSPKIIRADSRNFVQRAKDNNRKISSDSLKLASEEIEKIEAPDDEHSKKCKQHINTAHYFYKQFLSFELSNNLAWAERFADDEIKPVQAAFDKKIALLKEAQNK